MTIEYFNERDSLYKNFKKIYKNLKPISFIPNRHGVKIRVLDKECNWHLTEVYVRHGMHKIKFPFENAVGFLFENERY